MILSPILRRSVVDQTYEALLGQILHGHWAPGSRVPTEAKLTQQLGVSRSTVREALNRLASAGLLRIPHGGSKVVLDPREHGGLDVLAAMVVTPDGTIDVDVVRDVTEMRGALAPDVARRAAERRTSAEAEDLLATASVLEPTGDLGELMEATLAWWTVLVRASHNVAYRLAYNTLRTTYTEGRGPLQQVLADELREVPAYLAIATAVQRQDADAAAERTTALVARGNQALFFELDAARAAQGG